MNFDFRTSFVVAGNDLYRFGANDGGGEPEPTPDTSDGVMRAVMRSVMRSPMAATTSPRMRLEN